MNSIAPLGPWNTPLHITAMTEKHVSCHQIHPNTRLEWLLMKNHLVAKDSVSTCETEETLSHSITVTFEIAHKRTNFITQVLVFPRRPTPRLLHPPLHVGAVVRLPLRHHTPGPPWNQPKPLPRFQFYSLQRRREKFQGFLEVIRRHGSGWVVIYEHTVPLVEISISEQLHVNLIFLNNELRINLLFFIPVLFIRPIAWYIPRVNII